MSKLALMLGQAEQEVKKLVDGLEAKTGFESIDVNFLAAHHQALRRAIGSLGLDPDDTTGPELYQTLQAKFSRDSDLLDKSLGIAGPLSDDEKIARVQKLIYLAVGKPEVWAIKASALKAALRQLPPNRTRKKLGYRTLESMLKRQELGAICHLAREIESTTWQKKFNKILVKGGSNYYEIRPVNFLISSELDDVKAEATTGTILLGSASLAKHSVLSLSLATYNELEKISRTNRHGLTNAVPALAWWQKMEHLSAIKDEKAISLNIKDVAHNWTNKLSYYEQVGTHAAHLIMNNLRDTYASKTELATQEIAEPEPQTDSEVGNLAREIIEV